MKEKIKKIPIVGKILLSIKARTVFGYDRRFFLKNFINGKRNSSSIEYDMLLEIHKLEKGMTCKELRPFGTKKVEKIMLLIKEYEKKGFTQIKSFAYNLAISSLVEYKKIYETKNWTNKEEYKMVLEFLDVSRNYEKLNVGAYNILRKDIESEINIDYGRFIRSRHSVRNFSSKKLKKEDIKRAVLMAINTPSACNRQMCKIYCITDGNKEIVERYAQGLSLFDLTHANYFIITFDVSSFYFIGERNQGWFNAGLIAMNFVNALHSLGIGSCFVQFANSHKEEQIIKENLNIPSSERIAIIIAAGYYDEVSRVPYSTRKEIQEVFKER